MRNIRHHPKDSTMAAFASGVLDEANSVVVSTHVTKCAACRRTIKDFEALGGACLETVEPVAMRKDALESFWLRAGEQETISRSASKVAANDFAMTSVPPLTAYIKGSVESLPWRSVAPGLSQHVLDAEGYRSGALRLLKIAPGTKIPKHSHNKNELTLILKGAYKDEEGEFFEGDLADLDEDVTHEPQAIGDVDCICLIATDAPLAFKGIVGKVVQPFVGL